MAKTSPTFDDLVLAFRKKAFAPLYLFCGEEQYLIRELEQVLMTEALAPHERDFNLDQFHGPDSDARTILAACAGYPMMAERRVVIVSEFDQLSGNEMFAVYAKQPNPTAVVLLRCATRPNFTQNPYKAIKKHGIAIEFKHLFDRQIPRWVTDRGRAMGYRVSSEAAALLVDHAGNSLGSVAAELDKLTTYVGDRSTVTAEDVLAVAGRSRELSVFALQKAIGTKKYPEAVTTAERLLQQASNRAGEALMIVSVLAGYFTRLWKLSVCQSQSMRESEMASAAGIAPYFVKEYLGCLRYYEPYAIKAAFAALLAADFELKGGSNRDAVSIITLMLHRMIFN